MADLPVPLRCTACEQPLTIHCGNVQCGWLECRARDCDAWVYDVDAGARLMRSGVVERWGDG
jgi:hypothetical protein